MKDLWLGAGMGSAAGIVAAPHFQPGFVIKCLIVTWIIVAGNALYEELWP